MTGVVTGELLAAIPIRIAPPGGQVQELASVIDTGFNGHLTAPAGTIATLRLPICGHSDAELGDGRPVRLPTYVADVEWFGERKQIPVLSCEGGVLVGMSLLRGCRLAVDVEVGGAVDVVQGPVRPGASSN